MNTANLHYQDANLYTAENTFTAAKYEEIIWDTLLPGDAESYRYHLAFEISQVAGFKTGYVGIRKNNVVVSLAPYFVMDYRLDTTVQGAFKKVTNWLAARFPRLMTVRVLCVGSPVTDSCKLGMTKDYRFDAEIIHRLHLQLEKIAQHESAQVIAFKDVLATDLTQMRAALQQNGYACVDNMPVASLKINFANMDAYLAGLSYATRKDLRRKLKLKSQIDIEEYDGLPPDIEAIYALYLNCYERSELKFEKLTLNFFESVPGLMPNQCRYVLYRHQGKLIGFNLLIHRDGVLLDKYIGLDYALSKQFNLYFLSWLHNIEICLRDGFHTYQSGQAAYETKIRLGASLEQTYIFFQHRNPILKPILKLASKVLAYGQFDASIKT